MDFLTRPGKPGRSLSEKGFTLIEAVMVIVIMGIIGAGILMYFVGLGKGSSEQALVIQATALAQEKMEKIAADRKTNGFASIISEPSAAMPAPYGRFTSEVEVYCVEEADLDAGSGTMPDCSDSDIKAKRVRVIISWPGGSTDFTTVISNH